MSSALARLFAVRRTGLPRAVLVLQGGNALNYFGTGLILPFEIIYLHAARLLDGDRGAGNVLNALGYGGSAFVDRPWQGFVCSAVAGAGFEFVGSAGQVLDHDPGPGAAARRIDRAATSRRQLRSRPRRDACGPHRRGHGGASYVPHQRFGAPLAPSAQ